MVDRPGSSPATVGRPGEPIADAQGLGALGDLVEAVRECIVTHAQETTKRDRLQAYADTEVTRIKAAESVLGDYFGHVFAERRSVFEGMFARLDRALDRGDSDALHSVVVAIVDIAKTSPLGDLGNLSQVRAALDDTDHTWEL